MVDSHVNNKSNPHGTTALQVGAVPSTGGTYTGPVIVSTGQVWLDSTGSTKIGRLNNNGNYLFMGDFIFGINASGDAVVGNTTTTSKVITEATFPTQKALVEPNYSVPNPDFWMPMNLDINIYIGNGTLTTANSPVYNTRRMLKNNGQITVTDNPLLGVSTGTMAMDFVYESTGPQGGNICSVFGFGSSPNMHLLFTSNGFLATTDSFGNSGIGNYGDGKIHRVVFRKTGTTRDTFIDGVLRVSNTTTNSNVVGGDTLNYYTNTGESLYFSNFRVWAKALTDKQISTL